MIPPVVIPYGSGTMEFPIPPAWRVDTAQAPPPPEIRLDDAALHALEHPVAGPRLRDLARAGMRVTVVVPDQTRACPTAALLPILLAELARGGVRESDVTVVIALGMHRKLRPAERSDLLGTGATRLHVEEAQGSEAAHYRDLGALAPEESGLPQSVPIRVHPRTQECGLLLSLGLVEPHQYAGWSGGRKTVAVGCAAAETIAAFHGSAVLEHPGTRLGALEGNPLHRALEATARRAGLRFVLNLALNGEGRTVAVAAGEPGAVLVDLVERALPYVQCLVDSEPYDAVFAGVGAPKDVNLYQTSRALTYIAFAREPLVRDGGWIVTAARCPENAGHGPAEEEFRRNMQAGTSAEAVLDHLRRGGFQAGGQRAFLVSKALRRYRMMVVGAQDPAMIRSCHLETAPDADTAMSRITATSRADARVLLVPGALATLPVPRAVA